MKANHLLALLNKDCRTIRVKFHGRAETKFYTYLTPKTMELEVGDFVLVYTNNYNYTEASSMKAVRVEEVHDEVQIDTELADRRYKYVVQKILMKPYEIICENQLAAEAKFTDLEAKRKARGVLEEYALQTGISQNELQGLANTISSGKLLTSG